MSASRAGKRTCRQKLFLNLITYMDEWQRGWMRATRNRVYGVTRIGGSNPSSSANYEKTPFGVFFVGWAVSDVAFACLQRTGLYLGHLNSLRSLWELSLLIKMFPRACRQKQPEQRLFLLSASPHPPITRKHPSGCFFVGWAVSNFLLYLILLTCGNKYLLCRVLQPLTVEVIKYDGKYILDGFRKLYEFDGKYIKNIAVRE